MQCAVTRGAWGTLAKAGVWAGRCGLAWSAVLVVHERLGQTGFVSRLSVSTEEQPNPSRNLPATRHFRSGVVTIY